MRVGGTVSYLLSDHLGSTSLTTNVNGEVVSELRYKPWGEVRYLTPEQGLFIHARLIPETGGEHGMRDLGLLQSAVARPQAIFDGKELYPDVYSKASAL
jgi:hypothetical protein